MPVNHVPKVSYDNPTSCCPKFNPQGWDGQTFVFKNKSFVRFINRNIFYIPLDLNKQIVKIMKEVALAKADSKDEHLMLSLDVSPWKTEHYLAVTKEVPGLENVKLSGTYLSKVFEGPYQDTPKWMKIMAEYVKSKKKQAKKIYMNYTMCPSCSKFYGKNYVVALAKV